MGSQREGSEGGEPTNHVESASERERSSDGASSDLAPSDSAAQSSSAAPFERTESGRVHVRRLDVLDTLRWSWDVAWDHRELLGIALAANLLTVAVTPGVTQSSPTATPEFADWVLPVYVGQLLAVTVAAGVFSLTAADAVADGAMANDARSLAVRLVAAAGRLPAIAGTTLVVALLLSLSALPAVAAMEVEQFALGSLLVVPVVYVLVHLLLSYQACVVDRQGPLASVRSGWRAARGNARKVFAVVVAYGGVVFAANFVAGLFGGKYDVASAVVGSVIGAVTFPVFGLALAHLYLESSRNR